MGTLDFQKASWNEMRDAAHGNAVAKGWWEEGDRDLNTVLELIASEVAESTEANRNHWPAICFEVRPGNEWDMANEHVRGDGKKTGMVDFEKIRPFALEFNISHRKPEGSATELADVVIRGLDYAGRHKFDLDTEIASYFTEEVIAVPTPSEMHMSLYRCISELRSHEDMKDGIPVIIYAIQEYFNMRGWNLREAIALKHAYNTTRPAKHGGKAF